MVQKGGLPMNKKALCGVLTTAVLFGTLPMTALASETLNTLDTDIMDFRNAEEDCEGKGWHWDATELTLTLENFYYEVPKGKLEEKAAIYLPDESYVAIEGENKLVTNSYHCDAFYCEGEVNFYGDGELVIDTENSTSSAFYVYQGPIIFDDEVVINVESDRGYIIYLKHAKGNKPLISIQDDARISFNKEDHDSKNITLTKKSGVETSANWFDYAEEIDSWDTDIVNLVAKKTAAAPEKEEVPVTPAEPETPALNEYKIVIGDKKIMKNGEVSYTADVVPYLNKKGYTMLPLRALLEVSNPEQQVNWNNGTKSAHTFVNNKLVSIRPGETTYTKALDKIVLYTPAETVNGRLFVSLRDWMSIMEIDVSQLDWNAETKTVTMKY